MLKLVAIDLDDTLLRPDGTISERVRSAIQRVRANGNLVTLATGRMFASARPFADDLGLDLPLITYQGALVKTSATGEVWRSVSLPKKQLTPLLEFLEEEPVHINLYKEDELYVAEMNETARRYATFSKVDVRAVGRLSRFPLEEGTKVVAIGDPDYLRNSLQQRASERFGTQMTVNRSRPHFLEFGHTEATKSKAMAHLGECLGIAREQMMAIGDSENDLDMVQYAGVGVAMGNAEPEVKAVADYITGTNEEDGVAQALEKFFRLN